MLVLDPREVLLTIGDAALRLPGVSLIAVDRIATRLIVEHSDLGPHASFVDAAEVRTVIRIVRGAGAEGGQEIAALRPGMQGSLSFRVATSAGDVGGTALTAPVVLTGLEHELDFNRGHRQTIRMIAVSASGAEDPVTLAGKET